MADKKIVMCGCHESGWYLIRDLIESGIKFSHFVCLTEKQGRKYNVSGYRDFTDLAAANHIPVYHPQTYAMTSPEDVAFFETNRFHLLIQGGWQRLFPENILQTLGLGAIGGHGSADFLPKGRGRSPLNWSIIEGRKRFIMQLFLMNPGADDGPVFDHMMFDINDHDTIRTLYYKVEIVTKRMLLRSLPALLAGTAPLFAQTGEPSYYSKRTPADGAIDWEKMDVLDVERLVRAVTHPYPGAFALLDGKHYKIWSAQIFDTKISYPGQCYGSVVERFDDAVIVNCRGGLLLVDRKELLSTADLEFLGIG
jgi:methionyl-tRNA formyltransferase